MTQTLQSMPGWIEIFYIRCGNYKLGPYYARRWKKAGKVHKQYIKPGDLERIRAATERHRERQQKSREHGRNVFTIFDNLNYWLTMIKRSKSGTLRPQDRDHLALLESQGPTTPGRPKLRVHKNLPPRVGEVPKGGWGRTLQALMQKHSPSPDSENRQLQSPNPPSHPPDWQSPSPNLQPEICNLKFYGSLPNKEPNPLLAMLPEPNNTRKQETFKSFTARLAPIKKKIIAFYLFRGQEGDPIDGKEFELTGENPDEKDPTILYRHYREVGFDDIGTEEEILADMAAEKERLYAPKEELPFPNQLPAYDWHDDHEESKWTWNDND